MRAICCIFCSICCTRYLNALKILLLDRFSRCCCCCCCCCSWCSCCCSYLIYEIEWTAKNGLQTSASATVCTLCGKVFKLSVINSVVGCCISSYCTVSILLYAHRTHFFMNPMHCWCVLLLSLFHKEVLCTNLSQLCEWTHRFGALGEFLWRILWNFISCVGHHDRIDLVVGACFFARNEIETEIYASVISYFVRSRR